MGNYTQKMINLTQEQSQYFNDHPEINFSQAIRKKVDEIIQEYEDELTDGGRRDL